MVSVTPAPERTWTPGVPVTHTVTPVDTPSAEAVTVALPYALPVTSPPSLTVATVESELAQAYRTPGSARWLAL